jgi:hypothetical protein
MTTQPNQQTEEEILQKARKRVDEIKSFYSHLAVYVIFSIAFVVIWAVTSPGGYAWFIWPVGGWGVAVALHAFGTFVFNRDTKWEKRAIEKEADKIKKMMQGDKK